MSPVMSAASPHGSQKQPRVLACVLCQHRKIKCDRKTPCSNCIKAKVACTPSTPAPTRKRRRPNQDLQERLARCEELLKQYAGDPSGPGGPGGPGGPSGEPPIKRAPSVTSAPAATPRSPAMASPALLSTNATPTTVSAESKHCRKAGTMIVGDDGNVRFMDNYVFASVYDELQKMKDIVETDDPEDASVLGCEGATPDSNIDLLLSGDVGGTSLEELQPDPVHIIKLWSVFLERINPLTKLVHTPTMQPIILEAATGMSSMSLNYQALLFSIFAAAVIALSPSECVQTLGVARNVALHRFNIATRSALIKYNFMKNYNMTALQALTLYFFTLEGRYDRHSLWILSGTIVRIAQKMGYHRDGSKLNLLPFETEMRRRIWWHILIQDCKCAIMSGLSTGGMAMSWDTNRPLNVNDSDISPDSTWPVKDRDGPSEMVFCVVLYELFRFKLEQDQDDDCNIFEAAVMGAEHGSGHDMKDLFEKYKKRKEEIEDRLLDLEERIIDVKAGNVHIAALSLKSMFLHKTKEIMDPLHEQPEWGTEIFTPKDKFFKVLLMIFEHKVSCHADLSKAGFTWFIKHNLQLDILAVFTGFLVDHPMGSLSDRAWECFTKLYSQHEDLCDMSVKQQVGQAQLTLRAWKAREEAFSRVGRQLPVPAFISQLRELVPSQDPRMSIQSTLASPSTATQQPPPGAGLDQLFGDYMNPSVMNLDMFGDLWVSNGNQLSSALFDGYYMGDGRGLPMQNGLPL